MADDEGPIGIFQQNDTNEVTRSLPRVFSSTAMPSEETSVGLLAQIDLHIRV